MSYEAIALRELKSWQGDMISHPTLFNRISKKVQVKMNSYIPEKIHQVITATIKQMIRGVIFGARQITKPSLVYVNLQETEVAVEKLIRNYKHTASVEGGVTGAGGILMGLADFPLLLAIKIKMLFDIANLYGFDVQDYKERVYLLHIFQLAFSSHEHRKHVYLEMNDWENQKELLPDDINQFDWRNFQLEYRDYIDLAKMAQLVPGIGAVVGVIVNYKLVKKLGYTAMNAYRMRIFHKQPAIEPLIKGTLPKLP